MINNAGIAIGGDSRDLSMQQWRRVLDVDLLGVVYGTVHAVSGHGAPGPRAHRQHFLAQRAGSRSRAMFPTARASMGSWGFRFRCGLRGQTSE